MDMPYNASSPLHPQLPAGHEAGVGTANKFITPKDTPKKHLSKDKIR